MTGKTILFFSCEPGGAEVLIPVIRLLDATDAYTVIVLSYGLGAARFGAKEIEFIEIGPVEKNDTAIIDCYRPDLIITSATSLPERDMSEKHIWHNARQMGVPTLAFIDQWQNYAVRFSGAAGHERLAYLPDYINCIDDVGEAEMTREGFERQTLVKFGHPYLSSLKHGVSPADEQQIRQSLDIPAAQPIALLVSEAIREHYGRSRGYDQYDVLRLFLDFVSASPHACRPLIKLHPKDTAREFESVLAGYRDLRPIIICNELTSLECIAVADAVYGMTSIMLIEAYLLGKLVVSLQPGLPIEDPLVISRHGLIPRLDSLAGFDPLSSGSSPSSFLKVHFDEDLFLAFLSRKLGCQPQRAAAGSGRPAHLRLQAKAVGSKLA